jgi:hypothetical protein
MVIASWMLEGEEYFSDMIRFADGIENFCLLKAYIHVASWAVELEPDYVDMMKSAFDPMVEACPSLWGEWSSYPDGTIAEVLKWRVQ